MKLRDVTQKRLLGLMVLLALVPLEVGAAALSHEMLGWVEFAFYCLALLVNLPLLALVLWRPLLGSVAALVLFLVLVPYQAVLGVRLFRLQQEADRIIAFAYQNRLSAGGYPADLESYEPSRPELMRFFHYRLEPARGGFQLSYSVGSRNTGHLFAPELGWWYLED
jgi:hypothetical protein